MIPARPQVGTLAELRAAPGGRWRTLYFRCLGVSNFQSRWGRIYPIPQARDRDPRDRDRDFPQVGTLVELRAARLEHAGKMSRYSPLAGLEVLRCVPSAPKPRSPDRALDPGALKPRSTKALDPNPETLEGLLQPPGGPGGAAARARARPSALDPESPEH
jgi:hypothetical protein